MEFHSGAAIFLMGDFSVRTSALVISLMPLSLIVCSMGQTATEPTSRLRYA
jgi:hypothetical protein